MIVIHYGYGSVMTVPYEHYLMQKELNPFVEFLNSNINSIQS